MLRTPSGSDAKCTGSSLASMPRSCTSETWMCRDVGVVLFEFEFEFEPPPEAPEEAVTQDAISPSNGFSKSHSTTAALEIYIYS